MRHMEPPTLTEVELEEGQMHEIAKIKEATGLGESEVLNLIVGLGVEQLKQQVGKEE